MYNEELYKSTRRLLNDLKWFLIHVVIYLPANILLVLYATDEVSNNWWVFIPIIIWASFLGYHGVYIYSEGRENRLKVLMSTIFPI